MLYKTTSSSNLDSAGNSSNENSPSKKTTTYCDNDKGPLPYNDNYGDPPVVWEQLRLTDLQWVGTLGVGNFGRVELVTAPVGKNGLQAFALKKMKKAEVKLL